MQETDNFKFKMPDGTDIMDINVINDNMIKIDNLLHNSYIPYVIATGDVDNYIATLDFVPIIYKDGMAICLKINITNSGPSTLNIDGLGEKNILDKDGNLLSSGILKANMPYTMRYNGSAFILQ